MSSSLFSRLQASRDAKKTVAKVAITYKGKILVGLRTDDGRWDLPGGHAESNETAEQAAQRETFEESGISVGPLEFLCVKRIEREEGAIVIYGFLHELAQPILPKVTPEMEEWRWVDMSSDEPVFGHWHNREDCTLEALGIR